MPVYRNVFLEKDEPPVIQPSLEDLLRPETEDEDALSLANFDDEQEASFHWYFQRAAARPPVLSGTLRRCNQEKVFIWNWSSTPA